MFFMCNILVWAVVCQYLLIITKHDVLLMLMKMSISFAGALLYPKALDELKFGAGDDPRRKVKGSLK